MSNSNDSTTAISVEGSIPAASNSNEDIININKPIRLSSLPLMSLEQAKLFACHIENLYEQSLNDKTVCPIEIIYEKVLMKNAETKQEEIKFDEYRVYIPNGDTKYDREKWRSETIQKGETLCTYELQNQEADSKLSEEDKGYKFSVRLTGYQIGKGHMYKSELINYLTKFCVCPVIFKQTDNNKIELFHRNVIIQNEDYTNLDPYGFQS
ncbi:unnamed protein product [Rotaria sordida]|uniref:Uncharacterized protein n=1 Tax=Rotaria sordida TaxID=392033 RepID=A0A813YZ01_9BILA|nr:unnamed protein product [Rotaria sordida]CAF0891157.1 unnamed protein product [Rotaria sordida]CAF4020876.1 unnamed protein product [Rotaria sordida]